MRKRFVHPRSVEYRWAREKQILISKYPVGAVIHVDEPFLSGISDAAKYFGFWASGNNLAIAAWNSRKTPFFQAVGDPLIER